MVDASWGSFLLRGVYVLGHHVLRPPLGPVVGRPNCVIRNSSSKGGQEGGSTPLLYPSLHCGSVGLEPEAVPLRMPQRTLPHIRAPNGPNVFSRREPQRVHEAFTAMLPVVDGSAPFAHCVRRCCHFSWTMGPQVLLRNTRAGLSSLVCAVLLWSPGRDECVPLQPVYYHSTGIDPRRNTQRRCLMPSSGSRSSHLRSGRLVC
mmetsp:Transcript_105187/g.177707  ORF Transcript_105187/g.177707 Transcript_105187/m.177707 type:complete len:203 (+) Transcript_105187:1212-1820(+)